MWINNKNVGSILAPIVFPTLSIEAWNAMQWNGMKWYEESCTLDNKAFTHYSIICVDRRRDDPAYVLFSLLAANIWNALFDDPKEIDFRSRNVRGNAGNRNRNGPGTCLPFPSSLFFFTDEGTLTTDTN